MKVILLYIAELILGYRYPKSKKVAVFSAAIMWVYYSLNTYSGDYQNYCNVYNNCVESIANGSFSLVNAEPGWSLLMLVPALTKMSYLGFRIFAGTAFVILLIYTVRNLTANIALALSVFSIFPFSHSMSVLRFGFAALVFAAFALSYIKGDKSIKSKILFFAGVAAATMFHYSMLVFIVFYFSRIKISKKVIAGIIAVALVLFGILRTDIPYNLFVSLGNPHFTSLAERWLSHTSAPGKLSLGMFALGIVLDLCLAVMSAKRNPGSEFSKNVERMYIYSAVFIPLVATTDQFTRLYIGMYLFNICSAAETFDVCSADDKKGLSLKKLLDPYVLVLFVTVIRFLLSDFVYIGTENEAILCIGQNLLFNLI